ncbi:MAG: LLM class flavin-dependent oxidoreductase [Afipia sp.]|nr:LLM class flavin-dependent oxidoreductase [Afipia sp.]
MSGSEFGLILALTIRGLAIHSYKDMRRVVKDADRLKFDSVWLCDHFLTLSPDHYTTQAGVDNSKSAEATASTSQKLPGSIPLLECWTALSALSRETERLRLGTSVLCNSYRNPAVLGKMAATLDVISDGRLDLGLGAGWFKNEFDAYGFPFPGAGTRIEQLEEALQIIRAMWTQPNPTFKGKHFSIDGAICDPPPVQNPSPPIWIGGEGDKVHRVAAKLVDGINMRWWSPERFKDRKKYIDDALKEFGRPQGSVRMSATLLVIASDDQKEVEELRGQFKAIPPDGIVAGSPDQCIARLKEYQKVGVNHFLFTIPHVDKTKCLQTIGEKVLPALKPS